MDTHEKPLTENEIEVLPHLIAGTPQNQISRQIGKSQAHVSRVSNRTHIKQLVEDAQRELIDNTLSTVISNQGKKIELGKKLLVRKRGKGELETILPGIDDKELLKVSDRCEERIMQMVGIAATHAQAPIFQQIINQTMNVLSSDVTDLLRLKARDDAIDIEVTAPAPIDEDGD